MCNETTVIYDKEQMVIVLKDKLQVCSHSILCSKSRHSKEEEVKGQEIIMKMKMFIFPHDYVSRSFQLDSFRSNLNPSCARPRVGMSSKHGAL